MSVISDMLRKQFKQGDDIRDEGLQTPHDIIRYDDIVYGVDYRWQLLDVYSPKTAGNQMLPVIISFHGGGWVYGDKERYQFYCMSLAQHGFAVVNFTYRLAPEFKYPSPLEDMNLVMTWVRENAEKYKFDLYHLFGIGDSAGAHLLALYTAAMTNPAYAKDFRFQIPDGMRFKALAMNCGQYHMKKEEDKENLVYQLMRDFLPEQGGDEELKPIDVIAHVTSDFPPVFLMSAVGDFLKAEMILMAERLIECNVPFACRFYGDVQHKLGHVFHCNIKSEEAKKCNDEECNFFRKFLD